MALEISSVTSLAWVNTPLVMNGRSITTFGSSSQFLTLSRASVLGRFGILETLLFSRKPCPPSTTTPDPIAPMTFFF